MKEIEQLLKQNIIPYEIDGMIIDFQDQPFYCDSRDESKYMICYHDDKEYKAFYSDISYQECVNNINEGIVLFEKTDEPSILQYYRDIIDLLIKHDIPKKFVIISDDMVGIIKSEIVFNNLRINLNGIFHSMNDYTKIKLRSQTSFMYYQSDDNLTLEKCLSDFIYWFELNKSQFTNIEYYSHD